MSVWSTEPRCERTELLVSQCAHCRGDEDIHAYAERRKGDRWVKLGDIFPLDSWTREYRKRDLGDQPWDVRDYRLFGFLAGVRNYSAVPPIAAPRGIPDDVSPEIAAEHEEWGVDAHSASWLTLREMLAFDYDQRVEDRRSRGRDGRRTVPAGEGFWMTWREFLGPESVYFRDLRVLAEQGEPDDVRVVFWFDN